jgi:hypothetical protein
MDFNDSPEEAAWRQEYRAWLDEHAPEFAGNAPGQIGEIAGGDYFRGAPRVITSAVPC